MQNYPEKLSSKKPRGELGCGSVVKVFALGSIHSIITKTKKLRGRTKKQHFPKHVAENTQGQWTARYSEATETFTLHFSIHVLTLSLFIHNQD